MAAKIPQQFIDELITRVDIVELIDARVPLRKMGRDYAACCPFHDEKSPSFTVSPTKQFYHCFGCGAHGTAISFLMEYERMGFVDAVKELASRAGLQVPVQDLDSGERSADFYAFLERCADFYRRELLHPERGAAARQYLQRRGLPETIQAEYGLGYAPPGWDGLARTLGRDGATQEKLSTVGMLIKRTGGGVYDRFRDRVMFPIRDPRGRVIGFGGRVLDQGTPKYMNSPETPVFHKGRELYGLYEARQASNHPERLVVVEGYMDVLALAGHDIRYTVATLGTATTREHLERLYRLVPEVVFCFDGDKAGRQAAWRALENALPVLRDGRQARFMFLPEGEDPDTLVQREGGQGFEDRVAHSVPVSTYFYERLTQQVDITTIDGRARLAELARPLLSNLPAGVFKHMMLTRLAEITRTDTQTLTHFLSSGKGTDPAQRLRLRKDRHGAVPPSAKTPVRYAIELLLQNPALANAVEDPGQFVGVAVPGVDLFRQILELLKLNPHLNSGAIVEHWRDREEGRYLMRLAQAQHPLPEADLEAEFRGAVHRILSMYSEQRTAQLLDKARITALTAEEKDELRQLLR
jgi:DNA primase